MEGLAFLVGQLWASEMSGVGPVFRALVGFGVGQMYTITLPGLPLTHRSPVSTTGSADMWPPAPRRISPVAPPCFPKWSLQPGMEVESKASGEKSGRKKSWGFLERSNVILLTVAVCTARVANASDNYSK